MKRFTWLGLFIILSLVLAACSTAEEPTATPVPEPVVEAEEMEEMKSIVDIAVEDGRFTTLVAAVQAAGLVDALKAEGPLTVFAPTDEAFAKLPSGTVEALLADPDQLREILLYHVVPGTVSAAQVVTLSSATTAQGSDVAIKVADGSVMINEALVTATDIETSNGVIHVVDAVIIPPADEAPAKKPARGRRRRSRTRARGITTSLSRSAR